MTASTVATSLHPGSASPTFASTSPLATCVFASTPWAGSRRAALAIAEALDIDPPELWFSPLDVPRRGRRLGVSVTDADWLPRYLTAVREQTTGAGRCWLSLYWGHQRWLARAIRSADASGGSATQTRAGTDVEVLSAWFPSPTFVWIRSADLPAQALRWYLDLHSDDESVVAGDQLDAQEVRWLEEVIRRQDQGWHTFFMIHRIVPIVVERNDLLRAAGPSIDRILAAMEITAAPPTNPIPIVADPLEAVALTLLPEYLGRRGTLSADIGVPSGPLRQRRSTKRA